MKKQWVIIQTNKGQIKAWRDYGQAWGSPAYEVLGYFTGSARQALNYGRALVDKSRMP